MKKITITLSLIIVLLLGSEEVVNSNEIIRSLTNGQCSTSECLHTYNIRSLTNGQCSTSDCFKRQINKSRVLPETHIGSYGGGGSYNYDVSGSSDAGYVTGNIDSSSGSRYVEGSLTLKDGSEVSFDGEWVGKGEVEGTDENGNSYTLEVE
jgi:hypothetical protein